MTPARGDFLRDPVFSALGFEHGFGQRGARPPENTVFPVQVHGVEVFEALASASVEEESRDDRDRPPAPQADVVLTAKPGLSVGVVSADCVPILVATEDGCAVAAIHAGWQGLASGVIESGMRSMTAAAKGVGLVAAVGPAARGCCYEVDDRVRVRLEENYSEGLGEVLVAGRPGHFLLDLPRLATRILAENGVNFDQIGIQNRVCTICNPDRFESYRREGVAAGRLSHFITRPQSARGQG